MSSTTLVENVVQLYGDLLFDLCESVLWSSNQAQVAFRSIIKDVKETAPTEKYADYERAWVLRIAFDKLKKLSLQTRKLTSSEQIELDASPTVAIRLRQFDFYFHRLTAEEQIILLLRDKYGLPYAEVATATGIPEGTIKGIRGQALRALENWLWEEENGQ